MEANIKYTISNEDLLGVLRTILLFLENLGFKTTSDALQNECLRKGYDIVKSNPAKLVLLNPQEVQAKDCVDTCKPEKSDKCTCTTYYSNITSTSIIPSTKNGKSVTSIKSSQIFTNRNISKESVTEKLYSDDYVPPATIESENPTKILSKCSLKKFYKNFENEQISVGKSQSVPSIHTCDRFVNEESKENFENEEISQQSQNKDEPLIGTITEISQTTIINSEDPVVINSSYTTGDKNNSIKSVITNGSGISIRTVSQRQVSSANNVYDLDDKNISLKINVISKTKSETSISNTYIADNNLQKEKDKGVVQFDESEQSYSKPTKIISKISVKSCKTADSNHEEDVKIEESTKVHKCIPCNQLPEIFVNEDKDTNAANQQNNKSTFADLDFKKIKRDLCGGDDNLKLQLVQALRWRITQNNSTTRYQVMGSYIRHDLLGLSSHSITAKESVPKLYLCPDKKTPNPLQEQMARLLNAFASLTFGRDYLCHDDVVSLLVSLIIDNRTLKVEIDSKTRDMLIATLQKLSLRNQQRMLMITSGLLEYLVSFLKTQHSSISKYCMEYSTALFMNLCLHKEARQRLEPRASEVIGLLFDLLDIKYYYCMPYVNGAIYSLLLNPHINKEAQRLKLDKLLEYHIQNTEGEMRRQLKVILKLHKNESTEDDCDCDPSVEPDEEGDYIEPELDSDDTFKLQPSGEDLLEKYKILFSVFGSQVYAVRLKCMCPNTGSSRPCSQPSLQKDRNSVVKNKQTDPTVTSNKSNNNIKNYQKDSRIVETLDKSNRVKNNKKDSQLKDTSDKSLSSTKNNDNDSQMMKTLYKSNGDIKSIQNDSQIMECVSKSATSQNVTENKSIKSDTYTTLQNNDNKTSILTSVEMYFNEEDELLSPTPSLNKPEIQESPQNESKPKTPEISERQSSKQTISSSVPSSKTKIFSSKRYQNLYNPPQTFTRTIPMRSGTINNSMDPCPPYSYKQRMSESRQNINPYLTCYRESYDNSMMEDYIPISNAHQCKPDCVCCNTRRKYSCNCYNAIKNSINIDDTQVKENIKSNVVETAPSGCQCTCVEPQSSEPMKILVNTTEKSDPPITPTTQPSQHISSSVGDFPYNELLCKKCPESIFHVCSNKVNYHCYDDVFLSRPRILRTPP